MPEQQDSIRFVFKANLAGVQTPKADRRRYGKKRDCEFGHGKPFKIDRNARCRIMTYVRAARKGPNSKPGLPEITRATIDCLYQLLFVFYREATGLCFPCLDTIAKAARCARSTVQVAIKALEEHGVLTWNHTLRRVANYGQGLFGKATTGSRVWRSSNTYRFVEKPLSSNTDFRSGQRKKDSNLSCASPVPLAERVPTSLDAALEKLKAALQGGGGRTA